jgi:hypothetical protein
MKVDYNDHIYEVKDISFKEKREIWRGSMTAFPVGEDDDIKPKEYYELLDKVEKLSGLTEKDYVNKDGDPVGPGEVDVLLQAVYSEYMGLAKKDK